MTRLVAFALSIVAVFSNSLNAQSLQDSADAAEQQLGVVVSANPNAVTEAAQNEIVTRLKAVSGSIPAHAPVSAPAPCQTSPSYEMRLQTTYEWKRGRFGRCICVPVQRCVRVEVQKQPECDAPAPCSASIDQELAMQINAIADEISSLRASKPSDQVQIALKSREALGLISLVKRLNLQ